MSNQDAPESSYFPPSQLPSATRQAANLCFINEQFQGSTITRTRSNDAAPRGQENRQSKSKSRHNSNENPNQQDYSSTGARPKVKHEDVGTQGGRDQPGPVTSKSINVLAVFNDTNGSKCEDRMTQDCSIDEYMQWRFIIHSNSHLEQLNKLLIDQLHIKGRIDKNGVLTVDGNHCIKNITDQFHRIVDLALGFDGITVKSVPLNTKDVDSVCNKIADSTGLNVTCYQETINNNIYIVFLTRNKHKVNEYLKTVLPIKSENQIHKVIKLNPVWQHLLKIFNPVGIILETLGTAQLQLGFKADAEGVTCTLMGLQSSVDIAKEEIHKLENRVIKKICNLSITHVEAVLHLNVTDYLNKAVRRQSLKCCANQYQSDIYVFGLCDTSVEQGCKLVESIIIEKPLVVMNIDQDAIQDHINNAETEFPGCITFEYECKNKLYVIGVRKYVEKIVTSLNHLSPRLNVGAQNLYTIKIIVPNETVFKLMKTSSKVRKSMHEKHINLEFVKEEETFAIEVRGEQSVLNFAEKNLNQFMKTCETKPWPIKDSKILQYMLENAGWNSLLDCAKKNDVILTISMQHTESCEDVSWYPDETVHRQRSWTNIRYSRCIELANRIEADTTSYCIKFTSSDRKKENKLKAASTVKVCVPPWKDENTARDKFFDKLNETLKTVTKKEKLDIAIIVEDVFDWPDEYFVYIIAKAAVAWLFNYETQAILRLVVLLNNGDIFNEATEYINLLYNYKRYFKGTENKLTVTVFPEVLSNCRCDVLVNTASKELDLSYGKVSKSLLKAAGSDLQSECYKKYPYGIKTNEVAVTKGYKLQCKKVFHVALDKYMQNGVDGNDCIQNIRYVVRKCLEEASRHSLESIAFPALGTGVLHYPVDLVCTAMFESVEEFRMNNPKTSLRSVEFIIYPKNVAVLKIFQDNEAKLARTSQASSEDPLLQDTSLIVFGQPDNVTDSLAYLIAFERNALYNPNEVIEGTIKDVNRMVFTIWNKYYAARWDAGDINVSLDERSQCVLLKGQRCIIEKHYQFIDRQIKAIKVDSMMQIPVPLIDKKYVHKAIKASKDKFPEEYCVFAYDMYLHMMYLCGPAEHVSEFSKDLKFELDNVKTLAAKETTMKSTREVDDTTAKDIDHSSNLVQSNKQSNVSTELQEQENAGISLDHPIVTINSDKDEQLKVRAASGDTLYHYDKDSKTIVNTEHIAGQNVKVYTLGHCVVYAYLGDLLKVKTDCIVNPANGSLGHFGGLAGVLAKAAGKKMIKESEEIIKKNGVKRGKSSYLPVTTVVKTSAGNLPYKSILHAVGPCWYDYKLEQQKIQCATDLCNTVVNCLLEAERNDYTTIAMPMISSGLFGVPQDVCAAQYWIGLEKFKSKTQNILKEIHFLDINGPMVDLVQREFSLHFRELQQGETISEHNHYSHQIVSSPNQVVQSENELQFQVLKSSVNQEGNASQEKHITARINDDSRGSENVTGITGSDRDDRFDENKPVGKDQTNPIADTAFSDTEESQPRITADLRVTSAPSKSEFVKGGGASDKSNTEVDTPQVTSSSNRDIKCRSGELSISNRPSKHTARDGPKPGMARRIEVKDDDMNTPIHVSSTITLLLSNKNDDLGKALESGIFPADSVVCVVDSYGKPADQLSKYFYEIDENEYRQQLFGQFQPLREPYDVVVTKRFGLGCRFIFHVVVSGTKEKDWKQVYQNVFKKAMEHDVHSLCLSLPCSDVKTEMSKMASEFYQACLVFSQSNIDYKMHIQINSDNVSTLKSIFEDCYGNEMSVEPDEGACKNEHVMSPNNDKDQVNCAICLDVVTMEKKLKCGHTFCTECIDEYFQVKQVCPTCGVVIGIITGDQPDGVMIIERINKHLAGYEKYKTIMVTYNISPGNQGPNHPTPGRRFEGINRSGYLPDSQEGREVCSMLKVAFERRLVFTIGTSRTTGKSGVITWNDIHHKTNLKPNTQFGYPDSTYLARVKDELNAKGVTEPDKDFVIHLQRYSSFKIPVIKPDVYDTPL